MNFKSLRLQIGTQEDVANLLGVTQQSVAKWENGQSYPRRPIIKKLSVLFGVSADEILLSIDNSTNK